MRKKRINLPLNDCDMQTLREIYNNKHDFRITLPGKVYRLRVNKWQRVLKTKWNGEYKRTTLLKEELLALCRVLIEQHIASYNCPGDYKMAYYYKCRLEDIHVERFFNKPQLEQWCEEADTKYPYVPEEEMAHPQHMSDEERAHSI